MTDAAPHVLVFGSINADLVFQMDRIPAPGQTLLARGLVIQPGGKGANQAVAAARDGAAVRMVGAVGGDALASVALAGMQRAGVSLDCVRRLPDAATGCASICTDRDGRNQIAVALGANALASASQVGAALLGPATTVLLQMEGDPAQIALVIRRAHAAGARVILNLAPAIPLDTAVLSDLDLLVVNEDEAATLAGTLGCGPDAPALHAALGIDVIRTLGGDGAEACTAAGSRRVRPPPVDAIDTTAAGDCFVGVLAAGLSRGASLAEAMRRACAAAALACTVAGSQQSLPDRAATDAELAAMPPGY